MEVGPVLYVLIIILIILGIIYLAQAYPITRDSTCTTATIQNPRLAERPAGILRVC